jgi:hypothetical protein
LAVKKDKNFGSKDNREYTPKKIFEEGFFASQGFGKPIFEMSLLGDGELLAGSSPFF